VGEATEFIDVFGTLRKRISAMAAQAYARVDVGATQAKLLRHIGKLGEISQAELARATDSDPTLTSRVLATLIERKLVKRERSKEDRRAYVLKLTARGQAARSKIERLRSEVAERIVSALDARDVMDFHRIAQKILAAFAD
jgi:DNA-binding MarR family transcriptional regulator